LRSKKKKDRCRFDRWFRKSKIGVKEKNMDIVKLIDDENAGTSKDLFSYLSRLKSDLSA
jgi:hypothetical protein